LAGYLLGTDLIVDIKERPNYYTETRFFLSGISRYQSLLADHCVIKTTQQQRTPIIGYALV